MAYGGRSQCRACSTCAVCPTGAKASTDLTHIPEAEATGNARVITDATVLRLEIDRSGEVSAAVYARPDKVGQRLTARLFVLAGGAVENARLLLLSASREFPDGLANRSGLVGKFFMSHPSIDVIGRAREKVYPLPHRVLDRHVAPVRDRARPRHPRRLPPRVPELGGADAGADRRRQRALGRGAAPARP